MIHKQAMILLVTRYLVQWFFVAYIILAITPKDWMAAAIIAIGWMILSIERRLNVGEKYR